MLILKAISKNPHTTLQVFLPVFDVVEALTHILHYARVPRLEDKQKFCAMCTISVNHLKVKIKHHTTRSTGHRLPNEIQGANHEKPHHPAAI